MAAALDGIKPWSLGHVIDGVVDASSQDTRLDVLAPSTGKVIASIPVGAKADVDRAVSAARAAFPTWRSTPPSMRAKVLNAIADRVDANAENLAALESLNTGKPLSVSRPEIDMVGDIFRFMGGASRALQAPATEEYVAGYVSMIRREPVGVVGAITPWNYPLLTAVFKMASILAAGNTMVLKPSELTPLTTLQFMQLVADILPKGVVNVVLGTGDEVGSAITAHPGINMVSLTGSMTSGQKVMVGSAASLKLTHLELGGKAPVIIFDDADVDAAVASVRLAGFWNAGQECGAATRLLCSASIYEQFLQKLKDAVSSIKVGRVGHDDDIEMGPLISEQHLQRVSGVVARAKNAGATIIVGGGVMPSEGFFYPSTIVTDMPSDSDLAVQEIFGPVVTVEVFTDEVEALAMANSTAFGLSASVWTADIGRGLRASSALNYGTVWVNTHLVLATEMPWNGFNASGHGRELSILALDDFSRTKHVMIAIG